MRKGKKKKDKTPKCIRHLESLSDEEVLELEKKLKRKGHLMTGSGLVLSILLFFCVILLLSR